MSREGGREEEEERVSVAAGREREHEWGEGVGRLASACRSHRNSGGGVWVPGAAQL